MRMKRVRIIDETVEIAVSTWYSRCILL
jgi:hypothetical protein